MKRKIYLVILISFLSLYAQSGENTDLTYGIKLFNDKIYDVAITQFSSFVDKYGSSISAPQAQYYLALSYMELKDSESGLKNFQKLLLNYPKSEYAEKAIEKIAIIYKQNKDYERAGRYYLQLRNFFPNSTTIPEFTYKAIELLFKNGNYEEIIDLTAQLKKRYNNNNYVFKAELINAQIHIAEKNSLVAERIYTTILKSATDSQIRALTLYQYANFLISQNNLSQASLRLKEVVDKYDKEEVYIPAVIEYCKILTDEKRFEDVANVLKNIKAIPTKHQAAVSHVRAENEFFRGNFNQAAKEFEYSLSLKRSFPVIFQTAYTYDGQGQSEKAANFLFNALKTDTLDLTTELHKAALLKCADFYLKAGRLTGAISAYQSYLSRFKDDQNSPYIHFMIGKAYYDHKRFNEAYEILAAYRKSMHNSFYDDDAIFLAAESALQLKEYNSALKSYQILIDDYSASKYYPIAQNRLNELKTHKIPSPESLSKLTRLTVNAFQKSEKGLSLEDWIRFSFYDLKDYNNTIQFCKTLTPEILNRAELSYIYATSLANAEQKEADWLAKSMELYDQIVESKDDTWAAYAIWDKNNLLKQSSSNTISERKKLLLYGIEQQLDNRQGRLLYEYISILNQENDLTGALKQIELYFKNYSSGIYNEELRFIYATILERGNELNRAIEQYRLLAGSKTNSVYALNSLKKIIFLSNDSFSQKLALFDQISNSFTYTDEAAGIKGDIAHFYALQGEKSKALEKYIALQNELDGQSINARWNFSGNDYHQPIGELYFALNQFEQAEYHFKKGLQRAKDMDKAEILKKLNTIYRQSGNSAALEYNLRMMSKLSGNTGGLEADVALADIDFEKENYENAFNRYTSLLKNPQFAQKNVIELRYIQTLFRTKRFAEGEERIKAYRNNKDFYDKNSAEPIFYLEKGNYWLATKEYDKALKAFDALISDFQGSEFVGAALYGKGRILFDSGKKEKAFEIWKEVVKAYPESPISVETNYNLGAIYLEREDLENAVGALQAVVRYPKNHRLKKFAYKHLIDLYRKTGLTDAAARAIREYINLYPDEEDIFQKRIEIGNLYQANEEYEQALEYFGRLLNEAKGEDEASVQFYIGETYRLKKDFRQAIKEFLKVKYMIKSDAPQDWAATASYNAALCYEELDEKNKAIDLLQEIVDKYGQAHKYGKQAQRVIERIQK